MTTSRTSFGPPVRKIAFGKIEPQGHRVGIFGPGGVGKAQPLDAKVLTPSGFIPMADIEVGQMVIGSDGQPRRVLGIYPQGIKDVYRVVFRDGSATECCEDHLWFTQTINERTQGISGAVRSLKDIRRTLRYGRDFNHQVPRVQPVQFAALQEPLPLDPWLLGVYLGDGESGGNVIITNPEPDIRQRIERALPAGDTCVSNGELGLRVKRYQRTNRPSSMKDALAQMGLDGLHSHQKFVPPPYLQASVEQRLSLLQGLIDSDGYVTNPGAIEFCTVSERLAGDVCFLIRSLGGSAKMATKSPSYTYRGQHRQGLLAYRIFASFPSGFMAVSSLKHTRKWDRPRWAIRHTIRSIEPVGRKPCQCIRIDAPDSLYVTDDFLLTHNTTLAATAPGPVGFIDLDDSLPILLPSLGELDVRRVAGIAGWQDIRDALHFGGWEDVRTIVIDSATKAEELALAWTLANVKHEKDGVIIRRIEDYGYGKGYQHVYETFLTLLGDLDAHVRAGRNVVMIMHDCTASVPNPRGDDWLRWEPRLQNPSSGKASIRLRLREWLDHLLFIGYDVDAKDGKARGSGTRTIFPQELPFCMAKSRTLAEQIELVQFDTTLWTKLFGPRA